ncbi:NlpC/P60 family protein [uncultured Desulfovibrio sp.]|uniref:NlpC/P60 family protein n=1 Tax=uncultured Desulfovibrio sp. TaxID=167968 RepID=UPI002621E9EF|nr:NlpC/P60 family protein [uncultured Desulfovibrio sp.]
MHKILLLLSLFCVAGLLSGCGSRQVDDTEYMHARYRQNYIEALHLEDADRENRDVSDGSQNFTVSPVRGRQVVSRAQSAIGTPYVPGGRNPGGFDCSGLVQWAYQSVGVKLPRTAREQSLVGKRITNIENMRAGDIVAFRHPRRGYHTGIYVGDGKFVHSPRRRTRVRINSLSDPYYHETFLGARRLPGNAAGMDLVAQVEDRMKQYSGERTAREAKKARTRVSKEKSRPETRKSKARSRATKDTGRSRVGKDKSRAGVSKAKARPETRKARAGSRAGKAKARTQASKSKARTQASKSTARAKAGKAKAPQAAASKARSGSKKQAGSSRNSSKKRKDK